MYQEVLSKLVVPFVFASVFLSYKITSTCTDHIGVSTGTFIF